MNEELASRLKRQEFQRMMAQKMGLVDNTIDPNKNRVMDPRLIHRNEKGVDPKNQPKK
jgi:hypothetical protein